jgi:hypothetical protein
MDILITVIAIVFGILQIILFFKIWVMTDDVRDIKNKYLSGNTIKGIIESPSQSENKFNVGSLVIEKRTGKQMSIIEINSQDDKYVCIPNGGITPKIFKGCEIEFAELLTKT